jgi:hypothetical protein
MEFSQKPGLFCALQVASAVMVITLQSASGSRVTYPKNPASGEVPHTPENAGIRLDCAQKSQASAKSSNLSFDNASPKAH